MSAPVSPGGGKKTNKAESTLLPIIQGKHGFVPSLVRGLLTALVPVYAGGLKLYLLPYRTGLRKQARLGVPVVCVGNLTTGGTGKTPMTQLVCRRLQERGLRCVVLSRGYGGTNEYGCAIVSDGEKVLLTAADSGDEPHLLATSLPGIPVLVGKDRRVTGALAVERFQPDIIVLDDGMQFWQLHRDMDVVLVSAIRPFDNGYPFPRGLLREPISHLKRASAIVITGLEMAEPADVNNAEKLAARAAPGKPIYRAGLKAFGLRSVKADGVEYTGAVENLRGIPVGAVCALGNPASFEKLLASLGARLVSTARFRDHAAVSVEALSDVVQRSEAAGAELLVTTEKDAARINFSSSSLPAVALQVNMSIDRETELIDRIESLVRH